MCFIDAPENSPAHLTESRRAGEMLLAEMAAGSQGGIGEPGPQRSPQLA
jgi:hypothetical protein